MLQGALISANYSDALSLLHNIFIRIPNPTLLVDGAINTKFLLLSNNLVYYIAQLILGFSFYKIKANYK